MNSNLHSFVFIDVANNMTNLISASYLSYGFGIRILNENVLINVNYGISKNLENLMYGKLHFEILSKF